MDTPGGCFGISLVDSKGWMWEVSFMFIHALMLLMLMILGYRMVYTPPPPQDLLFASFCLPKVLPESFLHNLKEKQKKQKKQETTKKTKRTKKNKKKQKKQKNPNPEGTLRKLWLRHFPQVFFFFFCFFLFFCFFWFVRFTIASGIFLTKTLSITGLWYSLFP